MSDQLFYAALKSTVGSLPVFPIMAAKSAIAPFVIYQRTSTYRDRTLAGELGRSEVTYRVDVYHPQLLQAEGIGDDIANGLLNYQPPQSAGSSLLYFAAGMIPTGPSGPTIKHIIIENEENASDLSGDPNLYRWMMTIRVVFG